jgi:hypothetical protein
MSKRLGSGVIDFQEQALACCLDHRIPVVALLQDEHFERLYLTL